MRGKVIMKLENGKLTIDLWDFLTDLEGEQKLELIETLSCQEAIIKHVSDQIITGFTENIYNGGSDGVAKSTPWSQLDIARREIAKNSSEIHKNEIEELEKAVKYQEDEVNRTNDRYCQLLDEQRYP